MIGLPVKEALISNSMRRTVRLPDDGESYPLPPGLGSVSPRVSRRVNICFFPTSRSTNLPQFPVYRVADYKEKLPREWVQKGGVFICMYQR